MIAACLLHLAVCARGRSWRSRRARARGVTTRRAHQVFTRGVDARRAHATCSRAVCFRLTLRAASSWHAQIVRSRLVFHCSKRKVKSVICDTQVNYNQMFNYDSTKMLCSTSKVSKYSSKAKNSILTELQVVRFIVNHIINYIIF